MRGYLGKAFQQLRLSLALSQAEMARRVPGVSRTTISLIEHGKRVKLETLRLILSALKLSPAQKNPVIAGWVRDCLGDALWTDLARFVRGKK
jgi:transcriptional regulator with XRE-family HTH domain